ncbi:MAG: signal recognition particle protein [Myxococcota bacterium]|nr:signal recognition particle protein [Myxococcota bacterium]
MLETLSSGFKNARERLQGVRELTEDNVADALKDVRASLLEADVDFGVVKDFIARVKGRALGGKVETRVKNAQGQTVRITPGQAFVKVCEEELVELMGPVDPSLSRKQGATSVMLVGLQGVGKTTVAAKLANHLKRESRKVLLVAADTQRPAAVLQLQQLGESIDVPVHVGGPGDEPPAICAAARERVQNEGFDAVVYDTAGRLAVDETLMEELAEIAARTEPANTLLVCDALMGRDAVNVAGAFAERLSLDGLVMTKLDGDSRGGAALAVKAVTGVPIKFLGTGETVDRLEPFRPEGLASRILGMGDVVGLVRDFEQVVDEKKAEEDAERLLQGQFGMDDLLTQLRTIQKMGPLKDILGKLPGMDSVADQVDEGEIKKVEAMIQSMTPGERKQPEVIDKSRATRIAKGSGRNAKDVTDLVGRFRQMREMMASLGGGGGGGLMSRIPGMNRLAGAGMPAGFDPSEMLGGGGDRKARRANAARARSQAKKKRKSAKNARRKGRKK